MREDVYTRVRDWIVQGVLEPEEKLRDADLALKLGVSRTPVREALRRLTDEGLVETRAQSWTRVAPLEEALAGRIYPILQALEPLALSYGFAQMDASDLERMRAANAALEKAIDADDAQAAAVADAQFHAVYLERAENPELSGILRSLKAQHTRFELHFWQKGARDQSLAEHAGVLEALEAGNLERAKGWLALNWQFNLKRPGGQISDLGRTGPIGEQARQVPFCSRRAALSKTGQTSDKEENS